MALHPLAAGFADVAGAYESGRPEYAPAVIGATGKLSRALLAMGLDVVAVEPQAQLREILWLRSGACCARAACLRCSRAHPTGVARRGHTRSAR